MPDRTALLTALICLAVETLACVGLLSAKGPWSAVGAVVLHTLAVLGFAWVSRQWLQAQAVDTRGALVFVGALALCIPWLAMVGLSAALFVGKRFNAFHIANPIERTPSPRLPHRPPELEKNLKFASGGLGDILRHSGDVPKRVLAVTAASRMGEREAMPFLKLAMSDTADEVRLLAFSVKDKIETGINHRIKANLAELPNVASRDKPTVHRALAFLYWELVYLDIAEGDLRTYMLDEADLHAAACLEDSDEASLHTLRGRIALERRQPDQARRHFHAALETGAEAASVATYLAEAAYLECAYDELREHLSLLPLHFRAAAPYHALCRTWGLA